MFLKLLFLLSVHSDPSNLVKDAVLLTLLLVVCVGCWLVYRQNQKFKRRMLKMTADMESLTKAEETLLDLQVGMEPVFPAELPRSCGGGGMEFGINVRTVTSEWVRHLGVPCGRV